MRMGSLCHAFLGGGCKIYLSSLSFYIDIWRERERGNRVDCLDPYSRICCCGGWWTMFAFEVFRSSWWILDHSVPHPTTGPGRRQTLVDYVIRFRMERDNPTKERAIERVNEQLQHTGRCFPLASSRKARLEESEKTTLPNE